MNTADVITHEIERRFPGARIAVDPADQLGLYAVTVAYAGFDRIRRADRELAVYSAMDRLPPEVVARVASITCVPA